MNSDYKRETRSIKELSPEDRPRERLYAHGEKALSTAELLAIIIGSGNAKQSAVELMQEVLRDCEDKLLLLSRLSVEDLMQYSGIGMAKAITLKATMELGRRRAEEDVTRDLTSLTNSADIFRYMQPLMRDLNHEECYALLLNNNFKLIKRVRISQGGLTETAVDVRVIMKHALLAECTALVLVHNHPSGKCKPSRMDDDLTERTKQACSVLRLRFMDHVIIGDSDYYSYAENGKI